MQLCCEQWRQSVIRSVGYGGSWSRIEWTWVGHGVFCPVQQYRCSVHECRARIWLADSVHADDENVRLVRCGRDVPELVWQYGVHEGRHDLGDLQCVVWQPQYSLEEYIVE